MQRRAVLVFVKYPTPGRVKTRLAASLGDDAAVCIYRRLVDRVFEILRRAPLDEICVLYDPPGAELAVRKWLAPCVESCRAEVKYQVQNQGDLGDRLASGFRGAFDDGAGMVVAIGTDCVAIDAESFAASWRKLETADAVFGPTEDGGYYLVAMKAPHADLFAAIPWSSDETLARSLQQAEALGLGVEKLPTLSDVDTADDWEAVRAAHFPSLETSD